MAAGDVSVNLNNPLSKRCAVFDGTNDYMDVSGYTLDVYQDLTISCWILPKVISAGDNTIFSMNGDGLSFLFDFNDADSIRFRTSGSNDSHEWDITAGDIEGLWTHLLVRHNTTGHELFINGVSQGFAAGTVSDVTRTGAIIGARTAASVFWEGEINDLRMNLCYFTDEEIEQTIAGKRIDRNLDFEFKFKDNYKDSSGNGWDATNHGTRLTAIDQKSELAEDQKYTYFDGTDDYADTNLKLDTNLNYTICGCNKLTTTTSERAFFGSHQSNRLYIGVNSDKYYFGFGDAYKSTVSSVGVINIGEWFCWALTTDGSTAKYYVNGVLKDSVSYNGVGMQTVTNLIGARRGVSPTPEYFIGGGSRDIMIYDRALTATELLNISLGLNINEGLIAKWALKGDYKNSVGNTDLTNSGSIPVTESSISSDLKAARTTANDKYLISVINDKVITAVVEEA